MTADRPATMLDPVCGMTVDVAEAAGLLVKHEGRTYAFCHAIDIGRRATGPWAPVLTW